MLLETLLNHIYGHRDACNGWHRSISNNYEGVQVTRIADKGIRSDRVHRFSDSNEML